MRKRKMRRNIHLERYKARELLELQLMKKVLIFKKMDKMRTMLFNVGKMMLMIMTIIEEMIMNVILIIIVRTK